MVKGTTVGMVIQAQMTINAAIIPVDANCLVFIVASIL